MQVVLNTIQWFYSINSQISTNVYLLHVRTEPHVLILLEVIAVIAWLDTLEATVKQVTTGGPQDVKDKRIYSKVLKSEGLLLYHMLPEERRSAIMYSKTLHLSQD